MVGLTEQIAAIRLTKKDNVATLLGESPAGAIVTIREMSDSDESSLKIKSLDAMPAGHKIAIDAIDVGGQIIKYGLPIARASTSIAQGSHVHIHNATSNISSTSEAPPDVAVASIKACELRSVVSTYLTVNNVPDAVAEHMADHLVEAHLRGVETHGIRRLKPYMARLNAGGVDSGAEPLIEATAGLLRIDGHNGVGHYIGALAADAVADAAKAYGAAVALVRNSNHFGFAGYYATRIAAQGMAAMVTSNGQVLVGPEGALRAIFSNDPVAIAAPLSDDSFFEFDMATSVTSRANIVGIAEGGGKLPPGVALDAEGNPTTDAKAAAHGILLPFGGDKGFGFIAAIELLTGVLTGGAYADQVASKEASANTAEGTAHFMLAINLEAALGRALFEERIRDMVWRMGVLPMRAGANPPRFPGLRRWALREQRLSDGIPLIDADAAMLRGLAAEIGVPIGF